MLLSVSPSFVPSVPLRFCHVFCLPEAGRSVQEQLSALNTKQVPKASLHFRLSLRVNSKQQQSSNDILSLLPVGLVFGTLLFARF